MISQILHSSPKRSLLTHCLLGALLIVASLSSELAAQFSPATGPVSTPIVTTSATSNTFGAYSVSRSGKTLTISRPGQSDYVYNAPGGSSAILSYAFTGASTVILRTVDANTVTSRTYVQLVNMETFAPGDAAVGLINREFFVTQSPNLNMRTNTDGQVLKTWMATNDAAINNVFEIALWRTDTGGQLCGLSPYNSQSGYSAPTGSVSGTSVTIEVTRPSLPPISNSCPLPAPNLIVVPDPLDFGEILSTATDTQSVTLSNTGSDPIAINAIATAGLFTPVGFAATTLDAGDSVNVDILFNPAGATGNFSESLPITRVPAVGAAAINVEGSSRAPEPEITISPANANFGCVNVGASPTRTFTIESSGDIPLTVTNITGPTNPLFTLTIPGGFATGVPIPVGNSFTFTVQFSPTAPGPVSDTIVIASDDPDNPTRTINLTGTGHVPAADFFLDPTITNLNYGEVEVGYRFGKGVRIVNNGDIPLGFQVEIVGDSRFGVSTDVNTPGAGSSGPLAITIPGTLNPCGGGTASEVILRVSFDATAPEGGPYTATLRISGITGDPAPPPQPIDINLTGTVIAAKTVDVALVLDRSGSMSEPMAIGTKESAVRSASRLFVELMRADVGDRMALLQFNTSVDPFFPIAEITPTSRPNFVAAIQDPANLAPTGGTSIAGGLYESFLQFDDPTKDIRAAFVVSDGKDNTAYTTPGGDITLSTLTVPAGIGVHALALGTAANTDLGILTGIAGSTGGTAMASDNVSALGVFDIEKFFLQTATTILGGVTTLDPVDKIYPGEEKVWQVELIPADKAVSFVLMYKNGVLPYIIEAPDGTAYPIGTPPSGFGQSIQEPPNARIVRLQLPTDQPELYAGIWKIRVRHSGKLIVTDTERTKDGFVETTRTETANGPIDYALAVSVFSNLRLLAYVSPQPLYLGDPITVTAVLSEEEVPITGATVDVQVRFPDSLTYRSMSLYDDGAHNDGDANDGVYAADFTETTQEGHYQFTYHAVGQSPRQGTFVRETFVGQYVGKPGRVPDDEKPDTPGGGRDLGDCCKWLVVIALLLFLILILLWICCRRTRFIGAQTTGAVSRNE